MKKTLALVLLSLTPVAAQLWKKTRVEVRPGEGIGPVKIGQPLAKSSERYLGKPALQDAASSEIGSGLHLYGSGDNRDLRKGILVRLNDGKSPQNVYDIQLKGIRASTPEGVFLSGPASAILKRYPQAQRDINPFSRNPEFCLPGLTIRTRAGKVEEFLVESRQAQRWRFRELTVVPGQKVGPFELGKAVPPSALELLGPPTLEVKPGKTANSGLLRWAIAGQSPARMIEVTIHDGRNPRAVVSVRVRGVRAQTDRRIKLGDREAAVRDIYPDGREGLQAESGNSWRIPGCNFGFQGGALSEIQIYDSAPTKTRR